MIPNRLRSFFTRATAFGIMERDWILPRAFERVSRRFPQETSQDGDTPRYESRNHDVLTRVVRNLHRFEIGQDPRRIHALQDAQAKQATVMREDWLRQPSDLITIVNLRPAGMEPERVVGQLMEGLTELRKRFPFPSGHKRR